VAILQLVIFVYIWHINANNIKLLSYDFHKDVNYRSWCDSIVKVSNQETPGENILLSSLSEVTKQQIVKRVTI
jgi:hypothetical protein